MQLPGENGAASTYPGGIASTARPVAWSATGMRPPLIVLGFLALFLSVLFCPIVNDKPILVRTFLGVAGAMFVWLAALWARSRATSDPLRVEFVPVKSHWVQGCVQFCILFYWGWYVPDVGLESPLIFGQLLYLTMLDALISWSRGRTWRLGFGAMPVIFSTNLLLWFHHDWYYFQFVMITIGALGKQFVTWERDGKRTHIFNPSVFGQFVVAVALIATGLTNELTRGQWIAATFEAPPYMLVLIFGLGLVVQSLFGVTLMTMAAATALWILNVVYTEMTGLYFFVTVNIAATIFLGLHLLITDPATSPRTNVGKVVFGAMYGVGYFALFRVLDLFEIPVFWDKLLPVPILNLMVPLLDRWARSGGIGRINHAWQTVMRPKWMNFIHMGVWGAIFATMMATGFLTHLDHPGNDIAFWKQAYADDRQHAAHSYVMVAGARAEGMGDPDAINELGVIVVEGLDGVVDVNRAKAAHYFARASLLGNVHASNNVAAQRLFFGESADKEIVSHAFRQLLDTCAAQTNPMGCYLVGVAYEFGRADFPVDLPRAAAFYSVAGRGDPRIAAFAAKGLARILLQGVDANMNTADVLTVLSESASQNDAEACWYLAYLTNAGIGARQDGELARELMQKACDAGMEQACEALNGDTLPPYEAPRIMGYPGWSTAYPEPAPSR